MQDDHSDYAMQVVTACQAILIAMPNSEREKRLYAIKVDCAHDSQHACSWPDKFVCIAVTTPDPVRVSQMDAATNGIRLHTSMHKRIAMHGVPLSSGLPLCMLK